MLKLKKSVSVFVVVIMLVLSFFSVPVFAAEETFDIHDYTIEDLMDMTVSERQWIIEAFIEEYNPFGIKELTEQAEAELSQPGIQPMWASDGNDDITDGQQIATHQAITLQALLRFIENYGFYDIDGTLTLAITLSLAAASGLPDRDVLEIDAGTFLGHFYDPDTMRNYLNGLAPTALLRASRHYTSAYNKLSDDPDMSPNSEDFVDVIESLGRALHYLQDVCEPHHVNNAIAGLSPHSQFESYVEDNISSMLASVPPIPSAYYTYAALGDDGGDLVHRAAVITKPYYSYVNDKNNQSNWYYAGNSCVDNAVNFSAVLIYKLFHDSGVPFM